MKTTVSSLEILKNQESLRKWKESLGLKNTNATGDSRKVIVLSMALQIQGRPDVVMDLTNLGFYFRLFTFIRHRR
jgi:Rho GDP-dissociation inhibitor